MPADVCNWVGATLADRYRIIAKLGEGGMGFVYKARDSRLDAEVVVKVPRPSMLEDPGFAGRFAREIRSLVRLEHPHIVRVTDVGEYNGLPFAVMQFLPGGSLRDRQPRGDRPLPPGDLRAWLESVAGALDFIHARQYVHRDVKPDNILFDAAGHAFLSDFGIAKAVADGAVAVTKSAALTGAGMVLGTPHYMAPELIMGKPYDGRVDQYALAVMVYEFLTGSCPFDGPNAAAIFVLHTTEAAPPLTQLRPGVPPALAAAVARGLAKDPAQRFACCADFGRAVQDAVPVSRPVPTTAAVPAASAAATNRTQPLATPASGEAAPQRVACPSCGKECKVRPELLGQRVRCPRCKQAMELPARMPTVPVARTASEAETTPPVAAQAGTQQAPRAEAPPGEEPPDVPPRKRPWLLLGAAAAVVLAVAGGGGTLLWLYLAPPELPAKQLPTQLAAGRPPAAEPPPDERPAQKKAPVTKGPEKKAPEKKPVLRVVLEGRLVTVRGGERRTIRVTIRRQNVPAPVDVDLSGLPPKVSVQPRASCTLTENENEATFDLVAEDDADSDRRSVRVQATAGDTKDHADFTLTVTPLTFAIVPSQPGGLRIRQGQGQAFEVRVDRSGGYQGRVALRIQAPLPPGVTATSSDIIVAAGEASGTIQLSASREASVGTSEIRVRGEALDRKLNAAPLQRVALRVAEYAGKLQRFDGHTGTVTCLSFAPDGRRFVSGGADKMVRVWDVDKGRIWSGSGHTDAVTCVAFAPDGPYVLSGSKDSTVRVWDANTGDEVRLLQTGTKKEIGMVYITASGKQLHAWTVSRGKLVWEVGSWKPVKLPSSVQPPEPAYEQRDQLKRNLMSPGLNPLARASGHQGRIFDAAYAGNANRVLSGGEDRTARVWDKQGKRQLWCFEEHKGAVTSVACAPREPLALSGDQEGVIWSWKFPTEP
jgi:hypothetical protein